MTYGGIQQLKVNVDEKQLETNETILHHEWKIPAATSAIFSPCDTGSMHQTMRSVQ